MTKELQVFFFSYKRTSIVVTETLDNRELLSMSIKMCFYRFFFPSPVYDLSGWFRWIYTKWLLECYDNAWLLKGIDHIDVA